ncbi:MAG TPA: ClpXP protease specificity-enhancing factor [Pseudomonadales bacterium]|nr:ClpXP protease specificity-enhancing factor [Pseudomonadales bacterium]
MTSHRPYLLRAMHEWILDNNLTPYVIVSTTSPDTQVPAGQAENGRIVLNVSPTAIRNLSITNERLEFDGRFGGRAFHVSAPIAAVLAVYAKESGQGMAFEMDPGGTDSEPAPQEPTPGSHLRVIK